LAAVQDDNLVVAAGTFSLPTFTGSGSPVQEDNTSVATGTHTTDTIAGSAAITQDDQVLVGVGTFAWNLQVAEFDVPYTRQFIGRFPKYPLVDPDNR
jgi:hypothetical protein